MERYQEALHKLIKHIDFPQSPQYIFDLKKDEPRKYYVALQEAVDKANKYDEKETLKKVKPFPNSFYIKICPNCGSTLETKRNYCDECGQRLDWSDEVCQQK